MLKDNIRDGTTAVCALIPRDPGESPFTASQSGESRSHECDESPFTASQSSESRSHDAFTASESPFTAPEPLCGEPREFIYIANCGDSRAVLCRDGIPAVFTKDHKPGDPAERARAEAAGAHVTPLRINGLACSRSLGDFGYKILYGECTSEITRERTCEITSDTAQVKARYLTHFSLDTITDAISPVPDILTVPREGDFLVLACDGIWDVMSNEDMCTFISNELKSTTDLEEIVSKVIDSCISKDIHHENNGSDNMSIILVIFP